MVEKTPRQIMIKAPNLPTTHPKWQDYDRNWDNKTKLWEERNMIYTWYIKLYKVPIYFQLWVKENKLWYLWVWDAGFRQTSTKHLKGTVFLDGARSCCRTEIRPRQVPVMSGFEHLAFGWGQFCRKPGWIWGFPVDFLNIYPIPWVFFPIF